MKNQERNSTDPKEKNQEEKEKINNPSVPGNDPDQTPIREIDNPPVAEPEKKDSQPKKLGF